MYFIVYMLVWAANELDIHLAPEVIRGFVHFRVFRIMSCCKKDLGKLMLHRGDFSCCIS